MLRVLVKFALNYPRILEDAENGLHSLTRAMLYGLSEELISLDKRIQKYDQQIQELACNDDMSQVDDDAWYRSHHSHGILWQTGKNRQLET